MSVGWRMGLLNGWFIAMLNGFLACWLLGRRLVCRVFGRLLGWLAGSVGG